MKQGGRSAAWPFVFFVPAILITGFFVYRSVWSEYCVKQFCPLAARAASSTGMAILINEVAWMGTASSTSDEWIELLNNSEESIDLAGWKLEAKDGTPTIALSGTISAGGYFLLERTDDTTVPGVEADMIFTGAIGNNNERLELKDASGSLVDIAAAESEWPAGDNGTKQTMERVIDGIWQTSFLPGGTPKSLNTCSSGQPVETSICGNGVIEEIEECDDGNGVDGDGCASDCSIEEVDEGDPGVSVEDEASSTNSTVILKTNKLGDVLINEFVSDPTDGETEWVELFNASGHSLDLSGWIIEEGSGSKTQLNGVLGIEGGTRFLVVKSPKGSLNNGGDMIVLRDNNGKLIDQVVYGGWKDGDAENNAPLPEDPLSAARKYDGYNTFNNAEDFALTETVTKGESNIISLPDELSEDDLKNYDYSGDIVLNELYPNPKENKDEFIELKNKGEREVDLTGWQVGDASETRFEFENAKISAGGYMVVNRNKSKIALNNTGDTVYLYQPKKEKIYAKVKYGKAAKGESYNRMDGEKEKWAWSDKPTPGDMNEAKKVNHAPSLVFDCPSLATSGIPVFFDASDTSDEDGDELFFLWSFGDGATSSLRSPEHTYFKTGSFTVKLKVSDGNIEDKREKIVKIGKGGDFKIALSAVQSNSGGQPHSIVLNELLPNPDGADQDGEFIEIFNPGKENLEITNWKITDLDKGKEYIFENKTLRGGGFLVLKKAESKFTLNNNGGSFILYDDIGNMVDSVVFGEAKSGLSYARKVNSWQWTALPTPGRENIFIAESVLSSKTSAKTGKVIAKNYVRTDIGDIASMPLNSLVIVKGVVAVSPGVLGSQYFYLVEDRVASATGEAASGIQIYNYKKDFPKLNVGDLVEVRGEITEASGERRIKTAVKSDFNIVGKSSDPAAIPLTCDAISENNIGSLVVISGQIVKKSGSTIYIDDGTDEAEAYIKQATGIKTGGLKTGDQVSISGIMGKTKTGERIMPRSQEDVVSENKKSAEALDGTVLGEVATSSEWGLEGRDKKKEMIKYFTVILSGAVIAGGWLVFQRRRKK